MVACQSGTIKAAFSFAGSHRVAMILASCATEFLHGQGGDIANSGVEWMQKAGVEQNLQAESGSTEPRNAACTSCVQMVASDLRS